MQFNTLTLLLTLTTLTTAARLPIGMTVAKRAPILKRATCDVAPTAATTTTSAAQPLSTPSATTAANCQTQCESNTQCQSFVFGTNDAGVVQCLLYSVPAAQIPTQSGDSLKAFDKVCTDVPTTAPTTTTTTSTETGSTAETGANTGAGSTTGTGSTAGTGANTATTGMNNRRASVFQGQQLAARQEICGSAPTGASTQSVTPLQTLATVNSATACLDLCKQTSGCES